MAWELEHDDELQLVQLTMSGKFTDAEIKECASARIAMGKEKGVTRFIIDANGLEPSGLTFAIYDVPSNLYTEHGMERSVRIAVLATESSAAKEMAQFYENVSFNRGWNAKAFEDRESAIEWLLE